MSESTVVRNLSNLWDFLILAGAIASTGVDIAHGSYGWAAVAALVALVITIEHSANKIAATIKGNA